MAGLSHSTIYSIIPLFRHPERSRPTGGVVEGPLLVAEPTEKVPPLRLAALGSGRDDGSFLRGRQGACLRKAAQPSLPMTRRLSQFRSEMAHAFSERQRLRGPHLMATIDSQVHCYERN